MNKNKKGFTLTELIIVIVIIGILAAVLIPSLTGYVKKARISNDTTSATEMTKLMSLYMAENDISTCDVHVLTAALAGTEYENMDAKVDGYSFWLDVEEKYVFLGKTDEALNGSVVVDAATTSNIIIPEAVSSNPNYRYIDKGESKIKDVIDFLYQVANGKALISGYEAKLNAIGNNDVKSRFPATLSNTLFISEQWMEIPTDDNSTLNVDESIIKTILFTPGIKTIPTNVLGTTMNFQSSNTQLFQLVLPQTVKTVKNNAFLYTNEVVLVAPRSVTLNSNNVSNMVEVVYGKSISTETLPTFTTSYKWNQVVTKELVVNGSEHKEVTSIVNNTETYPNVTNSVLQQYLVCLPTISGNNFQDVVKSVKLVTNQLNGQTYYVTYAFDGYGRIIGKSQNVGFINDISEVITGTKTVDGDTTTYSLNKITVVLPLEKLENIVRENLVVKVYINNSDTAIPLDPNTSRNVYSKDISNISSCTNLSAEPTARIEVSYDGKVIFKKFNCNFLYTTIIVPEE